ncbi:MULTISPECIES: hypothetical protein [Streptomyces]|nr:MULTISPECIES: hypothetical protein [Streptomyces]MCM9076784.1 hypothetical protein [Streptomyces spororaveus]MCX5308558.1 hypothetical protein [Streptomyces sp. NBC_00160]
MPVALFLAVCAGVLVLGAGLRISGHATADYAGRTTATYEHEQRGIR